MGVLQVVLLSIIIQTTTSTTPATTTPTTTVRETTTLPPTKPTPFVPCDLNCYDAKRDCNDYDTALCHNREYINFFKINCQLTCGFCTEKPSCKPLPPCAEKQGVDCASFGYQACLDFPEWAKETCPKHCGFCCDFLQGRTTLDPLVCVDQVDCTIYGDDVCTDFPDYSAINCRQFCGLCVGVTTPQVCDNKIDCSKFGKDSCTNPEFRKYMLANCRLFCDACNADI